MQQNRSSGFVATGLCRLSISNLQEGFPMPPNSAMDGDTVGSPLRAPCGARHRGR